MTISARESNLGELLWDNNAYVVPVYQRDYAWEKEQTTAFWDTVLAATTEHAEYFLGSIVLVKTEANQILELLDGQQRMATLALLLAAFRSELESLSSQPAAEAIGLIGRALEVTITRVPQGVPLARGLNTHVRLNERDATFFEDFLRQRSPQAVHRSHERIEKAYSFFRAKIRDCLESGGRWNDIVHLWDAVSGALSEHLQYVRIEVSDIDTAQAVFESLNSAGLALTKADLIKNYLLMESRPSEQAALAQWNTTLDALGASTDLTQYIRTFCNSHFEFVRTDRLYAAVKSIAVKRPSLSSQETPDVFLRDLAQSASIYAYLASPDSSVWTEPEVLRDLEDLRDLAAVTVLVPLLAAYRVTSAAGSGVTFKQVLSKFLTFQVRSIVVGPRTANEFETQYSEWAVAMSKGTKSAEEVLGELDLSITSDDEFLDDMRRLEVRRLKTARVLLARINDHAAPKTGAAAGNGAGSISDTIRSGRTIHVEHVIPQTETPYWNAVLDRDGLKHENVVERFGNLTLLRGRRNIQVSNGPFIDSEGRAEDPPRLDKNLAYRQAPADINWMLAEASEFGKAELEARQEQLAQWAVDTWRK